MELLAHDPLATYRTRSVIVTPGLSETIENNSRARSASIGIVYSLSGKPSFDRQDFNFESGTPSPR